MCLIVIRGEFWCLWMIFFLFCYCEKFVLKLFFWLMLCFFCWLCLFCLYFCWIKLLWFLFCCLRWVNCLIGKILWFICGFLIMVCIFGNKVVMDLSSKLFMLNWDCVLWIIVILLCIFVWWLVVMIVFVFF